MDIGILTWDCCVSATTTTHDYHIVCENRRKYRRPAKNEEILLVPEDGTLYFLSTVMSDDSVEEVSCDTHERTLANT